MNKIKGKHFSVSEGKSNSANTIDINNDELIEKIGIYINEKNVENLNMLLSHLVTCRVLIPAHVTKDKKPLPKILTTSTGDKFMGIYTDKDKIPPEQLKPAVMNLPYMAANAMVLDPGADFKGIVINPFNENFMLEKPLVEKIAKVEEARKNAANNPAGALASLGEVGVDENGNKVLKMNEKQYNQFECTQFEVGFLPKKFFASPAEFIMELTERRCDYIDELFEQSYQEKRMYPFIPEDFSMMPLSITDTFTVIRIDMPEKDIAFGNAYRLYLCWDSETNLAKYFRIVLGKEKGQVILEEICNDGSIRNLGDAPVEGTELAKINELCGYEN